MGLAVLIVTGIDWEGYTGNDSEGHHGQLLRGNEGGLRVCVTMVLATQRVTPAMTWRGCRRVEGVGQLGAGGPHHLAGALHLQDGPGGPPRHPLAMNFGFRVSGYTGISRVLHLHDFSLPGHLASFSPYPDRASREVRPVRTPSIMGQTRPLMRAWGFGFQVSGFWL